MTRRSLALLAGIPITLLGGSFCYGQSIPREPAAESPPSYTAGGDSGQASTSGEHSARQVTPSTDPKRTKLIDTLLRQIGKLKPADAPKKSLEDYFVLGTADLNVRTKAADVRFEARQGQQSVAEYLVDYVLTAPENTLRKWHVFSRHKEGSQAEEALAQLRRQYDQSLAYQAQLRKIYAASTMRRT
jgi:hypothetical protein